MRVMITRPRDDAEALAGLLAERGIEIGYIFKLGTVYT